MKHLLLITLLVTGKLATAQTAKAVSEFIPKGYEERILETGDLNRDKIPDAILLLTKKDEDYYSMEKPAGRPLIILLGKGNNKYVMAARNDNAVLCYHCGGAFGDPLEDVVIKNGYFSVQYYGGGRERWSREITFKYNDADKKLYLYKDGTEITDTFDLEKEMPVKIKTAKDFGKIPFEKFDIYND